MEKEKNKAASTGAAAGGKSKHRWTAVDTAILLLVVLAVAGLVYRVVDAYNEAKKADKIEKTGYSIHFTVDEMQATVLNEINGGDVLYIREDGTVLGYIAMRTVTKNPGVSNAVQGNEPEVEMDKAMTARPIENGTDPDAVTVEGVFICQDWTLVDGSLKSTDGNRYLTRGSVIEVRTDRAAMTIRITEINSME